MFCIYQPFVLLYCSLMFYCMDGPQFAYPFYWPAGFWFGAVTHKAAITFLHRLFSFLLDKYVSHRVDVCVSFKTLPNRMYPLMVPLATYESSDYPPLSLILAIPVGVQRHLVILTCISSKISCAFSWAACLL